MNRLQFTLLAVFTAILISCMVCVCSLDFAGANPAYPAPGEDTWTPVPTRTASNTPTITITPTPMCGQSGRLCTAIPYETRAAALTLTAAPVYTQWAMLTKTAYKTPTETTQNTNTPTATEKPSIAVEDEKILAYLPIIRR